MQKVCIHELNAEGVLRQFTGVSSAFADCRNHRMEERCGHSPVMEFAHSHQAWIDTALALGWGGSLLLALLFLYFIRSGWQLLRNEKCGPWAFALLLVAAFWLLRGFADSIYREHYLQMQALLLGYLFRRMQLEADTTDSRMQA